MLVRRRARALELTEAFQRIVWRHVALIVCVVGLGVVVPLWSHTGDEATYQAKTRVAVETADLKSAEESAALADSARGIVTTEGLVAASLKDAGAARDVAGFAHSQVQVRAMGASGVLEVSVTDTNPRVAAAVANSLARKLIESRQQALEGGLPELLETLDTQIAAVATTIAELEASGCR